MKTLQFLAGTILCSLTLISNAALVLTVPRDKTLSAVLNAEGVDDAVKQSIVARLFLTDSSLKTTNAGKNAIRKLFGNDPAKVKSAEDLAKGGTAPSAALPKDTAASITAVSGKSGDQAEAALSTVATNMKKDIVKPLADALNAKKSGLAKKFFADLTADVK